MSDIIKHDDGEHKDRESFTTLDPTKTKYNLGRPFYDGTTKRKAEYHLTGHAN